MACIEQAAWAEAIGNFRQAAAAAERANDAAVMVHAGNRLQQLGEYAEAWRLFLLAGRIKYNVSLPEWDGTDQPDRTLSIRQLMGDIAAPVRFARLIPLAARRVRQCTVFAEPRLVPLFRRSFAGIDIQSERPDTAFGAGDHAAQADLVASYPTLCLHLAPDAASIARSFTPLRPDPARVTAFRSCYADESFRPLVGISWASTNPNKELPGLEHWAALIGTRNATFVSLQYGDTAAALAAFRAASGKDVIQDPAVDQLRDLDTFAAQVAALDVVVTISNTTAHMAGALGVPTFVIIGDKVTGIWPYTGQSPWYPSGTLLRKQHRPWEAVFAEVQAALDRCIAPAAS